MYTRTQKEFLNKDNQNEFLSLANEALKIGFRFKTDDKIVKHLEPDVLKELILEPVPEEGMEIRELLQEFETKVVQYSTNFASKNFLAFPDAGNAVSSMLGGILLNFLNQNLINSKHCAPAGTFVEIAVIQWLRSLIGYPIIENPQSIFDVGGAVVTGGVLANTISMLLAREHAFPGTKNKGITFDPNTVKILVPEHVNHYSIRSSLGWLGIGEESILCVKTKGFKMDINDLRQKIKDYKQDYTIMAVVAYAGDSRTMTIDNFRDIHDVLKNEDIWFHIDACHGFQYGFSDELRHKIAGIELADSVTGDPHKVLFTPYYASVVLTKNPRAFKVVTGVSDLILAEDFAFGQVTPFLGSRNFSSLKIWFLIKALGRKRIGELIEERHKLAESLAIKVVKHPAFLLINSQVDINSVVFIYVPKCYSKSIYGNPDIIQKVNRINKALQERLFVEGNFYVHTFPLPDAENILKCDNILLQPLRFMGGNPLTEEADLDLLLAEIQRIGKEETERLRKES